MCAAAPGRCAGRRDATRGERSGAGRAALRGSCAGTGGAGGMAGGTLRRLPCVLEAGLHFYLRVFPRVIYFFFPFPRGTSNFFSPKLLVL